jgi:hypothetical protein
MQGDKALIYLKHQISSKLNLMQRMDTKILEIEQNKTSSYKENENALKLERKL